MNIGVNIGLVFGAMLALTADTAAQQVPEAAGADARSAAAAAIEWFATRQNPLGSRGGTLVVSGFTSARIRVLHGDDSYTVEKAPVRDLGLSHAALARVADRSSVRIATCNTLSEDFSLCGMPQPWSWLVLDHPGIRGDRAVINLNLMELEPLSIDDDPVITGEIWEVFLNRHKGVWTVDRAAIVGVS